MPHTLPDRLRGLAGRAPPASAARIRCRPRRIHAGSLDKLLLMLTFAMSTAANFTVALLITFLGIGVVANVLIAYAVAQVAGERAQNAELRNGSDRRVSPARAR